MKGYTEVTVSKALKALEVRNKRKDIALMLEKQAIADYATEWKLFSNFFSRWLVNDLTDYQLLCKHHKSEPTRILALKKYLDEEEYQKVSDFNGTYWSQQGKAIRQLVNASTSGVLLLDNELCSFINEFSYGA